MTGQTVQLVQFGSALCAGAAAWLLVEGPSPRRRLRLLMADGSAFGRTSVRRSRLAVLRMLRRPDPGAVRAALAGLAVGGLLALWGRSPLPLLAAVLLAPLVARWWQGRWDRRAADLRRDAVIEFCLAMAGEVRAGRPPGHALAEAGAQLGEPGAAVVAAARYGGDVPGALRSAAASPGAEGLRGVAACWQVAVDGGASLASGLERVAEALRAERDQHEDLRAQLAGARSTVLVLAALPVFGLLLGAAMGAEPLQVLLHSPAGLGCLLVGVLLEGAGLAWMAAIIRSAERAAS